MAVLIQIFLPPSDAVDDFVKQNQLVVVLLMTSDSMERKLFGEKRMTLWMIGFQILVQRMLLSQMRGVCCLYQLNHWLSLCLWLAWITTVKGSNKSVWKVRWVKNIT